MSYDHVDTDYPADAWPDFDQDVTDDKINDLGTTASATTRREPKKSTETYTDPAQPVAWMSGAKLVNH